MHPILIRIGNFTIPSYGVLVATGILMGWLLAARLARRVGLRQDVILDLIFWCVLAGLLGGRLTYILIEWRSFLTDPVGSLFGRAGQVFLGGFVAAIGALIVVARRYGVPAVVATDILAPSLALGHAFGRVGCFLAGCCYGAPTHSPLGVHFPRLVDEKGEIIGSLAYVDHLAHGWITPEDPCSLAIYPTQLFEAVGNLVICGLLLLLWRRRRFEGQVALAYILLYSTMRFGLEFLRGDAARGIYWGLSTSQWISLVLIACALMSWRPLKRRYPCSSELHCVPAQPSTKNKSES
jgi:phosphatidylglycerol:prolipoprotein diacylglycerol transferase